MITGGGRFPRSAAKRFSVAGQRGLGRFGDAGQVGGSTCCFRRLRNCPRPVRRCSRGRLKDRGEPRDAEDDPPFPARQPGCKVEGGRATRHFPSLLTKAPGSTRVVYALFSSPARACSGSVTASLAGERSQTYGRPKGGASNGWSAQRTVAGFLRWPSGRPASDQVRVFRGVRERTTRRTSFATRIPPGQCNLLVGASWKSTPASRWAKGPAGGSNGD